MPRRKSRPWRIPWVVVLSLAAIAVVAGGWAAWRFDHARRLEAGSPDAVVRGSLPVSTPTATPTPVPLPAVPAPPFAEKVAAALRSGLGNATLGDHVVVRVTGLGADDSSYTLGDAPVVPASTVKLLTSTAALASLGPEHVFTTSVVTGGQPGQVVLVGGGDPYLASRQPISADRDTVYPRRADLATLARETAENLRVEGRDKVRLGYDASLFGGPAFAPSWEPSYRTDEIVAPISALWVDGGRPARGLGRVPDPAAYATRFFARELISAGVRVQGAPAAVTMADDEPETLAVAESAPLGQMVEELLATSDNEAAEVLARHVGLSETGSGSFGGAVTGITGVLRGLGVPLDGARLYDGSGLSRSDRLDPLTLIGVLRVAAGEDHPELRPVITGLPVAGFSGSLATRFGEKATSGLGRVRAKTGTLTGVSGLAGLVTDATGNTMAFVIVADRVAETDTLAARDGLDRLAAALADCRCSR
jgi:serine-type D-Ala-D-Ala carboxypeptidase/endopeptidase (penicillin-binding protein 4)